MKKHHTIVWAAAVCLAVCMGCMAAAETVSGVVFHDKNGNGILDKRDKGIKGVLVSNGRDVVATDNKGRYRLPIEDDMVVFVNKPAGWMTPVCPETNIPRFYYVHKPAGSPKMKYAGVAPTGPLPESVNFALRRQKERTRFQIVCLGDTQTRNQQEVDYLSHAIVSELRGIDAAFGVTLGDVVFDDLSVFEPMAHSIGQIGLPWRHVPGNHDLNQDAPDLRYTADSFIRVFGPSYHAFAYGQVHFIVLNDIHWHIGERGYHAELGADQLKFVEGYLRHVPRNRLVVLFMHIPIAENRDRRQLFALLENRPHTFSLSAHTHDQRHVFLNASHEWQGAKPHHHLIHATACGSWWGGNFDERSIPLTPMADGVPKGYSLIQFDGNRYQVTYKAAGRPADYQMSIYAPDPVPAQTSEFTEVIVNVFAGSERSRVEMRVGESGAWILMQPSSEKDPYYLKLHGRQGLFVEKITALKGVEEVNDAVLRQIQAEFMDVIGRGMPKPDETPHLWKATLPAGLRPGYHTVHVRTTDMFGAQYSASRVIRVE